MIKKASSGFGRRRRSLGSPATVASCCVRKPTSFPARRSIVEEKQEKSDDQKAKGKKARLLTIVSGFVIVFCVSPSIHNLAILCPE